MSTWPVLPKIAWAAGAVAFVMTGAIVMAALAGQIFLLPFGLIPMAAGIGIVRGRVWSAYGLSLFLIAQLLPVTLVVFRTAGWPPGIIGATVLAVVLIPL